MSDFPSPILAGPGIWASADTLTPSCPLSFPQPQGNSKACSELINESSTCGLLLFVFSSFFFFLPIH